MANGVAAWYDKDGGAPVARIGADFAALVLGGIRRSSAKR
jgi:hypothetical protein